MQQSIKKVRRRKQKGVKKGSQLRENKWRGARIRSKDEKKEEVQKYKQRKEMPNKGEVHKGRQEAKENQNCQEDKAKTSYRVASAGVGPLRLELTHSEGQQVGGHGGRFLEPVDNPLLSVHRSAWYTAARQF